MRGTVLSPSLSTDLQELLQSDRHVRWASEQTQLPHTGMAEPHITLSDAGENTRATSSALPEFSGPLFPFPTPIFRVKGKLHPPCVFHSFSVWWEIKSLPIPFCASQLPPTGERSDGFLPLTSGRSLTGTLHAAFSLVCSEFSNYRTFCLASPKKMPICLHISMSICHTYVMFHYQKM